MKPEKLTIETEILKIPPRPWPLLSRLRAILCSTGASTRMVCAALGVDGYKCTQPKGHNGMHAAEMMTNGSNEIVSAWSQGDECVDRGLTTKHKET